MRRQLYQATRLLNDLHAIERGRVPQRIVRKVVYKHAFKAAGWLCRKLGVM